MSKNPVVLRPRLLSASIAAIMGSASTALILPVHAQEVLEEVFVTGSRIVQRDFTANSPIVSVESDLFESTGTLGVETVLNQLPQFVPEVTQFQTADIQPSATVTTGANLISLRGLGANRNLVLVDGRRPQPVNALLVVDTNTIPSVAIERVEVVTGGASATYGADAVAGVVNFIMKQDFEGIELDVQSGQTELGDAGESRVAGLFGANFEDGRGNVMMGVELARREDAPQWGREFFDKRLNDPTMTGTNTFLTSTGYTPTAGNLPDATVVAQMFTRGTVPNNGTFYLNRDNTLYADHANGGYRYTDGTLGGIRKVRADGSIDENQPFSFISTPLDRYSLFGRGAYEFLEGVEVYAQGNFTQTETKTLMGWSPATGIAWGAQIPHGTGIYAPSLAANGTTLPEYRPGGSRGLNCAPTGGCTNSEAFPVPTELAQLLDSRRLDPDGTGPLPLGPPGSGANATWTLARAQDYLGIPRSTTNKGQTFQLLSGLRGNIDNIDGSWDVYVSHGETDYAQHNTGFGDLQNYRNIVQQANYGRGSIATAPGVTTPFTGNGGTATCTTGLPIFEQFTISDDCLAAVTASMTDTIFVGQSILEGTVEGRLANMRAGELRFAAGASYRQNEIDFEISQLNSASNTASQPIGQFPGRNANGETEASDLFAEISVPLLRDAGPISDFSLDLGARYTDFGDQGTANTYKSLFSLGFEGPVRVRGGVQRANRAPNVGELFSPEDQEVQATAFNGDPCGTNSFAPWGANAAFNPSGYQNTIALCTQLMGPDAAAVFYAQPQTNVFASVSVIDQGNPNLDSEVADTTTLGVVLSFEQVELSVDWYKIQIEDIIGSISYDTVYRQCISPEFNPSGTPSGSPYCSADWIQRDPESGGSQRVTVSQANLGFYETSGVDVNVNWRTQVGSRGMLGVNVLSSFLDSYLTQDLKTSPLVDSAGTGARGGQFDYRLFSTVSYSQGPFSTSLRMRYYPSIKHATAAENPATTTIGAASYNIFDLGGRFSFNETYELRVGIDNLTDTEPNIYGATPTTTGNGLTLNEFYDVLGRRYYVGFSAQF
jgi:outer membrane receptor protein involved in Fe transport